MLIVNLNFEFSALIAEPNELFNKPHFELDKK